MQRQPAFRHGTILKSTLLQSHRLCSDAAPTCAFAGCKQHRGRNAAWSAAPAAPGPARWYAIASSGATAEGTRLHWQTAAGVSVSAARRWALGQRNLRGDQDVQPTQAIVS